MYALNLGDLKENTKPLFSFFFLQQNGTGLLLAILHNADQKIHLGILSAVIKALIWTKFCQPVSEQ